MFLKKDKSMMLFGLEIWQKSARGFWLFLGVYLFATLFGALLTPPLYWLAQWLAQACPNDTTLWLAGKRADVFFDRIRWIPILVGIPWVMKLCGLFSLRSLGISLDADSLKKFALFMALGALIGAGIYAAQLRFGGATFREDATAAGLLGAALSGLLSALVIGFLEETVFRALIMRCFYTAWGATFGVLLSSLFFAYKHFKVPSGIWQNVEGGGHSAEWHTGFTIAYYDAVGVFMNFNPMIFASLAMFGVLLCLLYICTRTLMAPIAFHAGIVWMMPIYKKLCDTSAVSGEMRELFGSRGMTDGWLALGLLSFLCAVLYAILMRRQRLKVEYF